MSAKELIHIPVWKGNRTLDKAHAETIKKSVGSDICNLDSNYSIVSYEEQTADGESVIQTYLIDGQHRASVVRDFYKDTICEPDFTVTVREKHVDSEADAVEYFNILNNVKRQHWETDPNLIVNKYISSLEKQFNVNKKCLLIRPKGHRPYLSSDKLREVLMTHSSLLKNTNEFIAKFVREAVRKNDMLVNRLSIAVLSEDKNKTLMDKALTVKFALAYSPELPWIREILGVNP